MKKVIKNIPNFITFTRILSSVLGIIFFIKGNILVTVILYTYGALTDMIDGYLARKYYLVSKVGQYLDAVSDKLYTLSIIILGIISGNYLMLIPIFFEGYITILNFIILKKNKKVFTERVGKFKTIILFPTMILGLISSSLNNLYYLFILLLLLTIYFEVQSILAYYNQLHGRSEEIKTHLSNKKLSEKFKLLFKEFIYYLCNPVKIIK